MSKNTSRSYLLDTLGLVDIRRGEAVNDRSLEEIFSIASKKRSPVRLLRLSGPKEFRSQTIAFVAETGKSITPWYKTLLDDRIPEIEFILANPYSEPFLTRMDNENKNNGDIWRVRDQVIEFAKGLLRASEQRALNNTSRIKLAFHRADLVWNLGIAGNQYVVARAYYKSATGHDGKVAEIHLKTGSHSRTAESYISYYNFIKNDKRTHFVHSEKELESLGTWPSLFKGNAILDPADSPQKWIEKSCSSIFGGSAEEAWLSYRESEAPPCTYFHPVKQERRCKREEPWNGETSRIHRINGITAAEMLWHVQKIGNMYPNLIPKLEILSGSIVYQAFRALAEFRSVGGKVDKLNSKMQKYPWEQKLKDALLEAGRFVTDNQQDLFECCIEASQLGQDLQRFASQPFRDAHLKNRIIKLNVKLLENNYRGFCEKLEKSSSEIIFNWLIKNTRDIDFETSFWKVTEWDDPLHILWSNSLGFNQAEELKGGYGLLETWWTPPESPSDENVLWTTLFGRSLREFCRRLWYNHVMPETYRQRYSIEDRDHFLKLALAAADHLDGYTAIKALLEKCQGSGDAIWNTALQKNTPEPVVAEFPLFVLKIFKPRVFVSYSHSDYQLAKQLVSDIDRNKVSVWIDEHSIPVGGNIPNSINDGLTESQAAIILISKSSLNSKYCKEELAAAHHRAIMDSSFLFIPVLIEPCDPGSLIRHRKCVDLSKQQYESGLKHILEKLAVLT